MSPNASANDGDYQVRISAKAKRARISVDAHGRVLVVLPQGLDPSLADELLRERGEWIAAAQQKMSSRYAGSGQTGLPELIELCATGESFEVTYLSGAKRAGVHILGTDTLRVAGADTDPEAARKAMLRWLARHLRPWAQGRLEAIGEPFSIIPARVVVRAQRTRWGSCSSNGTISLNLRTAFIKAHLADYVVAHELAHMREMSHSPRFWSALEELMPGARALDKELSMASRTLPGWLL